jgi:tetraacyldisaccharide 4'-kinase
MHVVLLPLGWLFGAVMAVRNWLFDRRLLRTSAVAVPVISVGNLTAGGTGKTPLVEFCVRHYLDMKKRVGVVSRGYRRRSRGVVIVSDGEHVLVDASMGGDEAVQVAQKFRSVPVVVGEWRADAARTMVERFGVDVIVLDDGFQHRFLRRDLDIVVMDAQRRTGREWFLPAGLRREPMAGLRRAGLVAFSRVIAGTPPEDIRRWYGGTIVSFKYSTEAILCLTAAGLVAAGPLLNVQAYAFSGIGDHRSFVNGLRREGITVLGSHRFADHHPYSSTDCIRIAVEARTAGADACFTTEKDAVRLMAVRQDLDAMLLRIPVYVLKVRLEFVEGEGAIRSVLDDCVGAGKR